MPRAGRSAPAADARRSDAARMATPPGCTDAELDRLRRRLYRPGAEADDVRRYEAARDAAVLPVDALPTDLGVHRSPLRFALIGAAVVLVLGAGAVLLRARPPDGALLPDRVPAVPGPVAPAVAAEDPTVTATRIPPATAVFHGRGAGTAWLDPGRLPARSGRLDLVLTLAETARVRWWVTRVEVGRQGESVVRLIAEQTWTQTSGVAVPVAFPYRGAPPTSVRMEVPDGVAWSLLVSAGTSARPSRTAGSPAAR